MPKIYELLYSRNWEWMVTHPSNWTTVPGNNVLTKQALDTIHLDHSVCGTLQDWWKQMSGRMITSLFCLVNYGNRLTGKLYLYM